jgi:hypothetical protein
MREVLWKMTEEEAIALQATVDEVLALAVEKQSQMPRRVVPRPMQECWSSTAMEPRLRRGA